MLKTSGVHLDILRKEIDTLFRDFGDDSWRRPFRLTAEAHRTCEEYRGQSSLTLLVNFRALGLSSNSSESAASWFKVAGFQERFVSLALRERGRRKAGLSLCRCLSDEIHRGTH